MKNISDNGVVAVVVTYQPVMELLEQLLDILTPQVAKIVVVDNGSVSDLTLLSNQRKFQNIEIIPWSENKGIAAAHCLGIERAREYNAEFVLLMDQDSIPEADMVSQLLGAINQKIALGINVAAAGPRYVDERNVNHPSFIRVTGFNAVKGGCERSGEIIDSDMIISSGCMIPLSVLEKVGDPIIDLFIDQVDIEWCLRAKKIGYQSYVVCDAKMRHSLGEEPKKLLNRKILHHSPLRHYYIFRNAVWLLFKNYVPLGWKFLLVRTILFRFVIYVCGVFPRLTYLKMMSLGIWHGLTGRLGKFEN